jgi:hypothetical protein
LTKEKRRTKQPILCHDKNTELLWPFFFFWIIQTLDSKYVLWPRFFSTGKSENTLCVLSFPLQLVNLNPLVGVAYTMLVPPQILQKLSIALSVEQIFKRHKCKNKHCKVQTTTVIVVGWAYYGLSTAQKEGRGTVHRHCGDVQYPVANYGFAGATSL